MASNRIMNVTEVFHMLSDVWGLYRKYANRNLIESDLDAFRQEAKAVYCKYTTVFAKEVILALIDEVGRNVAYFERKNKDIAEVSDD